MFIYKHTETIDAIENWSTFLEKCRLQGETTQKSLVLKRRNFQCIISISK